MGYIKNRDGICSPEFAAGGKYQIQVNGIAHSAKLHLKCPVDPDRRTILA
jgi:hypothetical protein